MKEWMNAEMIGLYPSFTCDDGWTREFIFWVVSCKQLGKWTQIWDAADAYTSIGMCRCWLLFCVTDCKPKTCCCTSFASVRHTFSFILLGSLANVRTWLHLQNCNFANPVSSNALVEKLIRTMNHYYLVDTCCLLLLVYWLGLHVRNISLKWVMQNACNAAAASTHYGKWSQFY